MRVPARGRRLFAHLFLQLAALLVCPTLGLGLLLAERLASARSEMADRELLLASQALAREVEMLVESATAAVEAFAAGLELLDDPLPSTLDRALVERFRERNRGFAVLYVATPDGRSFMADPATQPDGTPRAPRSYADRQYYRSLVHTGATTISPVQLGRTTWRPNIHIAVPIKARDGTLRAYVAASLDLSVLQLHLERVGESSPGSRLLVTDQNRHVVAHADPAARSEMRDLSALPLFAPGGEILRSGQDDRGIRARAAAIDVDVRGLSWTVAAYLDEAELAREAWAVRWRAVAIAGGTLLIGMLLCAGLAARLARPIGSVAQAAAQVGDGKFDVTLPPPGGEPLEVAQLIDAVAGMAQQRQRLEAQLTDRAEQLGAANRELARNLEALHEAQAHAGLADRLASVGTLAAGVAHEINNPTAYVRANVGFALQEVQGMRAALAGDPRGASLAEVEQALGEASEGTDRIQRIVRDLQVFGRGDGTEEAVEFDPTPIVESAISITWNELRHKATLVRRLAPVAPVQGHPSRLAQVVLNLVVNALHALPDGDPATQQIRISTRQDGDTAVIEVEDTGHGIPAEHLGRIFDPFFTTKAVGRGTGLGLAISREIISGMGGEIRVTSTVGQGSTFQVRLPGRTHVTPPRPTAAAPAAPLAAKRRGRVLVIDDEAGIRTAVRRVLGKEHEVSMASDAATALALLRQGPPFDVIFCDLMMPGRTGVDLYGDLTRELPSQAARIVFLTGGVFDPKVADFLERSQRRCIEKPFQSRELGALVREMVDEGSDPA